VALEAQVTELLKNKAIKTLWATLVDDVSSGATDGKSVWVKLCGKAKPGKDVVFPSTVAKEEVLHFLLNFYISSFQNFIRH
jgi:hypothetical protein